MCGATSGAGKSTVTAGLCRLLARDGIAVAPFKAQNMSNHAAVSADGGEVGRAQAMQAAAAGIDVETAMNPILLKPTGDGASHVVVMGREVGRTSAVGWGDRTRELRSVVLDALTELRSRFDTVIAEGAGGAAEINLLERDLVNLPLARAAGMPALLVVDIEPGGAFAAAYGSLALLPDELRDTVGGIVFNRFRGDATLLRPGIAEIERRTGVPVLGVLPHLGPDPLLGVEDSLDVGDPGPADRSTDPIRAVAVALPHLANPSDLDPLAAEPDVDLRWASTPGALAGADLVVIPGSRATVADLRWLRATGFDVAFDALVDAGATDIVGICAGQQLLGRSITDEVESGAGRVAGLGLVALDVRFHPTKVVRRRTGTSVDGHAVRGYQIHHGVATVDEAPWLRFDDEHGIADDGAVDSTGTVRTTSLHGVFDPDDFRTAFLRDLADRRGRTYAAAPTPFSAVLDAQHDRLADWLTTDLDLVAVRGLIERAIPTGSEPGW